MSLFFETSPPRTIPAEDLAEWEAAWEREAGLRLLDYLSGITKKALSLLSKEARDWFRVDLSDPPNWFDSTQPHLVAHELHRRFGNMPTARAEWIDYGEDTSEALEVLFTVGSAVRSIRGVKQEQAAHFLRVLDAGIRLGHTTTKAHVLPWEPLAKTGKKTTEGASLGGKTRDKWKSRSEEMQGAVDKIHDEDPDRSYEHIKRLANRRHGFPLSALKRYTKNPRMK